MVVNGVLPLADVVDVALQGFYMREADWLLQSVPRVKHITAMDSYKAVVKALRPKVVPPGGQHPQVPAPLLKYLTLGGAGSIRKEGTEDVWNPLVDCVRERCLSGHRLGRVKIRDLAWFGQSEAADLSSVVDVLDFEGEAIRDTQKDSNRTIE